MAKNIIKKEDAAIAEYEEGQAWGAAENEHSDDLLIPKIWLMQKTSKFVEEELAKTGQWIDSLDSEKVIADKDEELQLIVFASEQKIEKSVNKQYVATEPYVKDFEWDTVEENGDVVKRRAIYNFYCILPGDVLNNEAFPYVVTFRSTNTREARKLKTLFKKLEVFKKPSAARHCIITTKKESNDKGTWLGLEAKLGKESSVAEMNEAYKWYKALQTQAVSVDDSDVAEAKVSNTPAQGTTPVEEEIPV